MALRFLCPHCRRELEVPDEAAGTAGTCQFCGSAIIAPSAPGQPAALAQAPGAPPPEAPAGTPVAQIPYGRIEPFGILSEAWSIVWKNFGPIALSTYIPGIIYVFAFGMILVAAGATAPQAAEDLPVWANLAFFALYLALSPLAAGPLYVVDDLLTKGHAEISATFRGFSRYRAFVVFSIFFYLIPNVIVLLLTTAASRSGPAALPLVMLLNMLINGFVFTTIYPGIMEIVDRDADGLDAVKASWEFTKGHRWMILITTVVVSFASMAGLFFLCVGVFVTMLLWSPVFVLIYRDIRGLRGGSAGFITGPPADAPQRSKAPLAILTMAGCGVVVIPILAAILFPVFAKGRLSAQQALCLKHMSNQGMALRLYAGDHGNRLPAASRWEDAIQPYLHDATDGCPNVKSGSGYVFNAAMGGQPLPTGAAAATTVLLFDGGSGGRNEAGNAGAAVARHGNNATVGYADGHVKMVTRGDLGRLQRAPAAP